ncbi:MAG: beta strand repeat-containing protein, partial [Planctomycetaceae bacterium]
VTGNGTQAIPWSITLPAGASALLVTAANDSLVGGSSTLTNSLTQTISNDASGGTFVLNLQINGGLVPTSALAQDSSAADIAAAILEATGITVTVTGCGEATDPWLVTPTYSGVVSDFQWGTTLVFDTAPGIADGTPVIYNAAPDKPIIGLSDGATYFLYSQINPAFNPAAPQYVMGLRATQDSLAPLVSWTFQQSLTDTAGNDYVITGIDRGNNILTVALTDPAPVTTANGAGLVGGPLALTTVEAGTWSLFNNATGGTFLLSIPTANGGTATTSPLPYNASGSDLQVALTGLPGISNVSVTGLGTLASPWLIAGTGLSGLASDDSGLTAGTMDAGSLVTNGYQVSTNATGGTFTLSFSSAGGLQQTTIPLAWNSSASDIQQAIGNLLGAGATVTGSGTANNPWNIDCGSSEMTIDDSQLTNGGGAATTSSEVGIQLWTNADGGTFCLSLTPTGAGSQTTTPLSATATAAQIQSALAALGYTATVTGEGTSTCPWSIAGPGLDGLAVSNSQLTQNLGGGTYFNSTLVDQTLLSTTATGGTFVLGMTVDGIEQVTAPLPWNSTAAQVQAALASLPGVTAWVSGSGSPSDPWVIQAFASSVQAGRALVFNDGWGVRSLGLLDGITYYAVPLPTQGTAGTLMLQLTATQSEALAATPTPLPLSTTLSLGAISTGEMFGSNMTLSSPTSATGITVQATLTAANSSTVYTQLGGIPLLEQRISQLPLWGTRFSISNWLQNDPKLNSWQTAYSQERFWNLQKGKPLNVSTSGSGKKITHQVLAVVGNPAQLLTAGSVLVQATVVNDLSGSVESYLASSGFGGTGVDVAANITVVTNTVQAIVESNASVTGGAGVSVDASVEYPYQFTWILDHAQEESGQDPAEYLFLTDTIGFLDSLGNGDLGIDTLFVNNWTDAAIHPSLQGDGTTYQNALSTSIQVVNVTTTTIAQIAAGAQINTLNAQLDSVPTQQPVSVTADTDLTQASFAGLMELNWGPELLLKFLSHGLGHAPLSLPSGAKSAGGTAAYYGFDTSTQAVIGANNLLAGAASTPSPLNPTVINYGNGNSDSGNHGLLVNAQTSLKGIQLGMSGDTSTSLGFSGVASVLEVHSQETFAGIVPLVGSNLTVASLPNTSGDMEINAYDNIFLLNLAGSVLTGSGNGAGVSTAVNIVDNRSVIAQLGVAPGQSSPDSAILPAGDVTLSAYAGGNLIAAALAADINSSGTAANGNQQPNQNAGDANAANQPASGFGIALSGDFTLNLLEANVTAIVNDIDILTAQQQGSALTINALDGTTLVDLAGGFAIQGNSSKGSVGLQGSVAVNYVTSNVAADILETSFTGFTPTLSATTHLVVIALAAGGSGPGTSTGANLDEASLSVAGSIAYNYVVLNPTVAVTNSQGQNLGSIEMTAVDNSYLLAFAGSANLPGLAIANDASPGSVRAGIGLAGALNDVTVNPQVEVKGASLSQTSGSIALSADQNLTAMAFAAGGGKVQGGTALGGQFTDTHLNSNVEVKVSGNSAITSSSPASQAGLVLQATLSPLLISVAGDVLINTGTSPSSITATVGAAVANTIINTSSNAQIDDSQITITNGEVQVLAGAGSPPPENVALTNQLGNINLPHFTGNSVYSFAVGAAATNSNATGEFSVVNNNIEQWDVCAQVTGGSTIMAGGNLQVAAADDATIVGVAGAFSVALTTPGTSIQGAVGASVTTNNFNGNVEAQVLSSNVALTGVESTVDVTASSTRLVGTAAAGGNKAGVITAGVAVTVNNIQSEVTALVGNPGGTTTPTIVAPGGVTIQANDTSTIGAGAGQVDITSWSASESAGMGNLSAGAAAAANSISMSVEALLTNAQVTANAGDVSVEATADANITSYAVGVSGTYTATDQSLAILSGAGSGTGNWSNSLVLAEVANSTVVAASLEVCAADSSTLESNAGSLDIQFTRASVPVSVSVGVSVAANYLGNAATPNTVTAQVVDSTVTLSGENPQGQALSIMASSTVNSTTASAAGAGSFNTSGSSTIDGTGVGALSDNNIYESVLAQLSGGETILTGAGNVDIQAKNQTSSSAGAGGLAIAGAAPDEFSSSGVAVSVGAALSSNIVTLSTEAMITDTATLTFPSANPGDLSLSASSQAKLIGVAVGVAGVVTPAGENPTYIDLAGAGSSNFNTLNTTVLATICDQSTVTGPASADISASDSSSAVSGTGALAIDFALQSDVDLSVGVSISENDLSGSVTASIDCSTLTTPGEVSVEATLEPGPEHGNAFAVAVAGSGAFASSGSEKFNLSGAGAGAGTFNTVEFTVAAEVTDNAQVTAGSLALTATDQSQVYSNAGGVGLAVSVSSQSAAAMAVGAGVGHNNVTNTVSASIENSTVVTTGKLSLNATSEPSIESIAFGVALGVAVSDTSASGAGSGAAGYNTIGNTTQANISQSTVSGGGTSGAPSGPSSLSVSAADKATIDARAGSGSLAASTGQGFALAVGAVIAECNVSNTTQAWLGTLNPPAGTTPAATNINVAGPVSVTVNTTPNVTAEAVAVAA